MCPGRLWRGEPAIRYCGHGSTPYRLTAAVPRDCHVYQGASYIATFETMEWRGDTLHIDHFAVDAAMKGQGKGEAVLRGFARLVAEQAPDITRITFDLYRHTEDRDVEKLAQARRNLLDRIGATELNQRKTATGNICVSAVWDKQHWTR
ncbi:MAG: hypothetical protein Q4G22_08515 [Paracoccus sp. (in: a-proteobacteria)]|uniref:hypothetical protein n=1 Tax=Paracoccus sp. TaxID=267 RepID=UPI0026DF8659|nr:hypothetical protein [Paracoccus sp. (in: a-proteobacteria)]MDO5631866.1 hypothetical protein [Paracoccus sp. (in: a-proteobacteria)]